MAQIHEREKLSENAFQWPRREPRPSGFQGPIALGATDRQGAGRVKVAYPKYRALVERPM